jgi:uncharacterized damage-inducible protein DinB
MCSIIFGAGQPTAEVCGVHSSAAMAVPRAGGACEMVHREFCATMARYNQWMNGKIYAVCAEIPDELRKKDMGAYFGSIHSTLNHLLYGDRAWLQRFGVPVGKYAPLGQDTYADFDELRAERVVTDYQLLDWALTVSDKWLTEPFEYTSFVDGKTRRLPAWAAVVQLFNHQIHHRGQVTTLLKQLGHDPGPTDLPWLPGLAEVVGAGDGAHG